MTSKFQTTLTPELKEKARKELNENEEWRDKDIHALDERVQNNKALSSRTDPEFLIRFLRARKFDYERSYKLLESYYKVRAENVQHFKDLKPSSLSLLWESGVSQVLPKPDKNGCRVIYYRPGKWDPEMYSAFDILKANIINLEIIIRDEETQVNGVKVLANLEGYGWEHVKNHSRDYYQLSASVMQESFPMRLKAFHFVNGMVILSYLFPIIKPFIKEKTQKRAENLYKPETGLSKEILPAELGGDLATGDELSKKWAEEVLKYEQMFVDMKNYNIVLPRNISKSSLAESEAAEMRSGAGTAGTFKKLNVD